MNLFAQQVRTTAPPPNVRADPRWGLDHLWWGRGAQGAETQGTLAFVDAAGNAWGSFGVGNSGTTGNYVRTDGRETYILFDNTGTGVVTSVDLPVGNTSGSGGPVSRTVFSFFGRVWHVHDATLNQSIYGGGAVGAHEARIDTTDKLQLISQFIASLGTSTGTLTANAWNDWGITYDGAKVCFFINGVASGSADAVNTFDGYASQYYLGHTGQDSLYLSNGGRITYVGVSHRVLTAGAFAALAVNPWQLWLPRPARSIYVSVVAAPAGQQLLPASDVSNTGVWTSSLAGDLFAAIDEASASDDDYIVSPLAINAACEIGFGTIVAPDTGTHTLHVRMAGANSATLKVELVGGDDSVVATRTFTDMSGGTYTTQDIELTSDEIDAWATAGYPGSYVRFTAEPNS